MPQSFSAAVAFERVRFLVTMGWSLSPSTLTWVLAAATLSIGLAAFTSGYLVLTLLSAVGAEQFIAPVAVIAGFYVVGAASLREIFGPRRLAVQASPNQGFFRALDIEKRHHFLVQAGPRSVLIALLTAAFSAAALSTNSSDSRNPLTVFVLVGAPVAFAVAFLALSARLAVSVPKRPVASRQIVPCAVSATAVSVPAYGMTRFLVERTSLSPLSPPPWWWSVAAGLAITALASGSALILRRSWHAMSADSFVLVSDEIGLTASRSIRHPFDALWTSVLRSRYRRMISNVSCLLVAAGTVAIAIRLGGFHAEGLPSGGSAAGFLPWLAFIVGLKVAHLISRDNGAQILAPRLRYLWEGGAETKGLVAVVLITQISFTAILTVPGVLLIGWAATGGVLWQTGPIIAAAVAATLLGGSVSRTTVGQADGSGEASMAAALLTFVSGSPVALLSLMPGVPGILGTSFYTFLLIGVAALCLRRRILRLPLSLPVSLSATSKGSQS
jgi:hypothetical protein